VARDRKRAKQRRDRRVRQGASSQHRPDLELPEPTQPQRADLPGSLDHASGEVDEFDAALVRGADGAAANGAEAEAELERELEAEELESEQELEPAEEPGGEDSLQEAPAGRERGGSRAVATSGAPLHGGNRVVGFLRASWAELQRVQWPDRRQVTQATAVVLGFVAVAGAYLGLADFVAKEIVEAILT
jgi:preprotein translocase SecE subunit